MSGTSEVLGYAVSAGGVREDVGRALALVRGGGRGHYVACANPHALVVARGDRVFADALRAADVLLPDGMGVVFAARALGRPIPERVAGYEFFMRLSEEAERLRLRYFFLGSTDEVLRLMRERLARELPAVVLAGVCSPPFKATFDDEDNRSMIDIINAARPHVLWVGMTAPKQEKWIYENRAQLDVPLVAAVGAVFDFYAGTKKRAGPLVRSLGLEWLPRLLREPRRLFVRNFVSTPRFLWLVMRQRLAMTTRRSPG